MLYKVGDKVKIKKREELEKCSIVAEAMLPYADTVATITHVDDWHEFYNIDIDKDYFRWDDECFYGRGLPDLPKEFEILKKFEREGWEAVPNIICDYIPASDIKTEPMFDILYERINELEKRIKELERRIDLVETLTFR